MSLPSPLYRLVQVSLLTLFIAVIGAGSAHGHSGSADVTSTNGIHLTGMTQGFEFRDIHTAGNIGGIRIYNQDPLLTTTPTGAAIQFWANNSAFPGSAFIDSGAHDQAAVIFRTAGTGGTITERMRITADGRVGIGSTNPLAKLFVNGDFRVLGNTVLQGNLSADGNINVPFGKVGIGTFSPRTALDLFGDIFVGLTLGAQPDFAVGSNSVFVANDAGDANNSLRIDGAGDNLYLVARSGLGSGSGAGIVFRTATAGGGEVDRFFIGPSGNVTIGAAAVEPHGHLLDVAGQAHATGFPTSSDARFKAHILPLSNVLEKLEQVRGISFDWNDVYESLGRASGHREIGVIAQEVEAVFPELVTTWGEEGYRAVDYGRLTAVLLEGLKELRAEKDAEIAAVRKMVATLQAQPVAEPGTAYQEEKQALAAHLGEQRQQNAALQERITALEQDLAAQQQQNAALEARLQALEARLGSENGETRQGASLPLGLSLLGGLLLAGLALGLIGGRWGTRTLFR